MEGLQMNNITQIIWIMVNILQITMMVLIFSIILTFPETAQLKTFFYLRISSSILYLFDMIWNSITQHDGGG